MDAGTLHSFFVDGFLTHVAQILLIISMLMRRMLALRMILVVSAVLSMTYHIVIIGNLVGAFWKAILLVVNIVQIIVLVRQERHARFSPEEDALCAVRLVSGTPGQKRSVLNAGEWVDLGVGEPLTRQGERPAYLTYIASGTVALSSGGERFATIGPGVFIGEMSLLGVGEASADAIIASPARVWRIERRKLDRLKARHKPLYGIVETAIALDLRDKVITSNQTRIAALTDPAV